MSQRQADQAELEAWQPRTRVGRLVKEGRIKSIDEIFRRTCRYWRRR